MTKRAILFVAPHASYRTAPYAEAAQRLRVTPIIASQTRLALVSPGVEGVFVDFTRSEQALTQIVAVARQRAVGAILGTDDATTVMAARAAEQLGLPHNHPESVSFARRKDLARQQQVKAGLATPWFQLLDMSSGSEVDLSTVMYPCIVKPVSLSASRGVIRVNNEAELLGACDRVLRLLKTEPVPVSEKQLLLLEQYIPGQEVAVEALLSDGELQLLTVFDKPDPLEGPYFEETYYISPSRLSAGQQQILANTVAAVCRAYGLRHGPVHAECRINEQGAWILEVAARTIGGLCSRLFRYGTGTDLETVVISHALGQAMELKTTEKGVGVLMIPITEAGVLRRVEGVSEATRIPYIVEVIIDIREGHKLVPLPEASSYLGFIFAEAPDAAAAEAALRAAHVCLTIVVAPELPVVGAGQIN